MTAGIVPATSVQVAMEAMSWHDGGFLMGMHWIWWAFWIVVFLALLAAFWRLFSDRSETRDRVGHEEAAEALLRRRFATGAIDEQEYARRLKVLRETTLGL